jgi:hypothetical protein
VPTNCPMCATQLILLYTFLKQDWRTLQPKKIQNRVLPFRAGLPIIPPFPGSVGNTLHLSSSSSFMLLLFLPHQKYGMNAAPIRAHPFPEITQKSSQVLIPRICRTRPNLGSPARDCCLLAEAGGCSTMSPRSQLV